jgi:hypothetical protein
VIKKEGDGVFCLQLDNVAQPSACCALKDGHRDNTVNNMKIRLHRKKRQQYFDLTNILNKLMNAKP